MYKLDPIEHLPDGSLFRLTPGQLRSVRDLTKRCCNFLDGECLLLDSVCPQYITSPAACFAGGFAAPCCLSNRSWNRPFSARKNSAAAKSAARAFSPAPAGQNTAPPAPRWFTASRRRNPPANGGPV